MLALFLVVRLPVMDIGCRVPELPQTQLTGGTWFLENSGTMGSGSRQYLVSSASRFPNGAAVEQVFLALSPESIKRARLPAGGLKWILDMAAPPGPTG